MDVENFAQSIVIVFELLLSFLNEVFLGGAEDFLMRKIRQLVLILRFHALLMDFSELAISRFENDRFGVVSLGEDMDGVPNCAVVIDSFGEFEKRLLHEIKVNNVGWCIECIKLVLV